MYLSIEKVPDTARAFIFPCKETLTEDHQSFLRFKLEAFLDAWQSHHCSLRSTCFVDKYLIAVFVDESDTSPSGCAIDALHRALHELTHPLGIDCFYYKQILCLKDETLYHYPNYNKVMKDWNQGLLKNDTLVSDVQVSSKGDFFSKKRYIPLSKSWLASLRSVSASVILCVCAVWLWSCSPLKKAASYTNAGEFYKAIMIYEKAIAKKSKKSGKVDTALHYQVAEAYRKINQSKKATPHYAIASMNSKYPDAIFHYVQSLKASRKYKEAEQAVSEVLTKGIHSEEHKERLTVLQKQLANHDQLASNTGNYEVQPLSSLNTPGIEYAPYYKAPWLYYVSNRENHRTYKATNEPYTSLFRARMKEFNVVEKKDERLSNIFNLSEANTGSITFYPKSRSAIFARGNADAENGRRQVNLFYASLTQKREARLFPISDQDNWDASPALSRDGKTLYFSSSRAGGYGGTDLYKIRRISRRRWSKPENLGPAINTVGNEVFPYEGLDGKLYFSSNGHLGFGGLDLFAAVSESGELTVQNLGSSINSEGDDFGMCFFDGYRGFFSSDRTGDDNLYFYINHDPKLKIIHLYLKVQVINAGTDLPVSVALVQMFDKEGGLITQQETDESGHVRFPVAAHENYTLKAEKVDFLVANSSFSTINKGPRADTMKTQEISHEFNLPIFIDPIILEKSVTLENIYYDLNKATLREDAYPSLDKLLGLMQNNPNITIELSSHTDSRANDAYNLDLSQRRAQSVVDYLILNNIDSTRMIARGYGETRLIVPQANTEEEHQRNRRTEFKILTYDRNKFLLLQEQEKERKRIEALEREMAEINQVVAAIKEQIAEVQATIATKEKTKHEIRADLVLLDIETKELIRSKGRDNATVQANEKKLEKLAQALKKVEDEIRALELDIKSKEEEIQALEEQRHDDEEEEEEILDEAEEHLLQEQKEQKQGKADKSEKKKKTTNQSTKKADKKKKTTNQSAKKADKKKKTTNQSAKERKKANSKKKK